MTKRPFAEIAPRHADVAGNATNPATVARDLYASDTGLSYGDAYREALDMIFCPLERPGMYPLVYTADAGYSLCHTCAQTRYENDKEPLHVDMYYAGPAIACADCGTIIVSAYGDPADEAWGSRCVTA